jgi:hypothetical protein
MIMIGLSFQRTLPAGRQEWESLILSKILISACLSGGQVFMEMTINKYLSHTLVAVLVKKRIGMNCKNFTDEIKQLRM